MNINLNLVVSQQPQINKDNLKRQDVSFGMKLGLDKFEYGNTIDKFYGEYNALKIETMQKMINAEKEINVPSVMKQIFGNALQFLSDCVKKDLKNWRNASDIEAFQKVYGKDANEVCNEGLTIENIMPNFDDYIIPVETDIGHLLKAPLDYSQKAFYLYTPKLSGQEFRQDNIVTHMSLSDIHENGFIPLLTNHADAVAKDRIEYFYDVKCEALNELASLFEEIAFQKKMDIVDEKEVNKLEQRAKFIEMMSGK